MKSKAAQLFQCQLCGIDHSIFQGDVYHTEGHFYRVCHGCMLRSVKLALSTKADKVPTVYNGLA